MTEDSPVARRRHLALAASFLALFVLDVVAISAGWLDDVDSALGSPAEAFTLDHPGIQGFLIGVEAVFTTLPMGVATLALAGILVSRHHRRAALWSVGVMLAASLSTWGLKLLFARGRPEWSDPVETLSSYSLPSGHASGIASGMGVAIVLTLVFVRRRELRQLLVGAWVALVLLVGLDRVMLGVHYPSDVVAGWLHGAFWVFVGLVVYHPAPRGHARDAAPLVELGRTEKRLSVVLNPSKVDDVGAFQRLVEQMAAQAGWSSPSWHFTTVEDPGTSMAEAAAVEGADLVLVCGGDGTVRTVCAELASTGIPVGIVPAGTGNLLARNLDVPLFLRSAVDVALSGQDRAIDMVAVSGDGLADGHFMVMAGMGFDAAIMEGVNEQVKAKVGWVAYVLSGLRSLMYPAMRVEVSVDGAEFTRHRARTVVIGNVGYLQAGMPLLPDATIDDGRIDVVLLFPRRFLSWIPLAVRVLAKRKRVDSTINRMTGRTVVVRASHDVPRQLDGDSIGEGKELRAECVHGRLLVRVPR